MWCRLWRCWMPVEMVHWCSDVWVPVERLYGVLADVRCLWKWCVACQAPLSDCGNGVWRVRRRWLPMERVYGVLADVRCLWKWCVACHTGDVE